MYRWLRPILFQLDPEQAHDLTVYLLHQLGRFPRLSLALRRLLIPGTPRRVDFCGLEFPNPLGLAAGYDKDGTAWKGLVGLGFGHVEVGTVTPRPQSGNPRPRIFRHPPARAVINRMGFPGKGGRFVAEQLQPRGAGGLRDEIILGVNIGKNKDTPNQEAVKDYLFLLREFAPLADYLVVNVSSPNTIGLRRLQARDHLESLLTALVEAREDLDLPAGLPLPILVKLAPDLTDPELEDALEAVAQAGVDGVVATNTTVKRPGPAASVYDQEGGLSGQPLREMSTEMITKISQWTGGDLPIIGVGGISSLEDGREKIEAGASLVQVYTGLVYRGPLLVRKMVRKL